MFWVPGHSGLRGDEMAVEEAREGSNMDHGQVKLDENTRKAVIRRDLKERRGGIQHAGTRKNYEVEVRESREEGLTKGERVHLARFRSGHNTTLRKWRKLVGLELPAECRLFAEEEESSDHLWLRCPALEEERRRDCFGGELGELFEDSVRSVATLRKILSRLK